MKLDDFVRGCLVPTGESRCKLSAVVYLINGELAVEDFALIEEGALAQQAPAPAVPTDAMVNAGAHVLSENYNDNAPIGEYLYRGVARDTFVAMRTLSAVPAAQDERLTDAAHDPLGLAQRIIALLPESKYVVRVNYAHVTFESLTITRWSSDWEPGLMPKLSETGGLFSVFDDLEITP